jgi:hypothetical protein
LARLRLARKAQPCAKERYRKGRAFPHKRAAKPQDEEFVQPAPLSNVEIQVYNDFNGRLGKEA